MDMQSLYAQVGGDYKEVLGRLMKDALVQKFLLRFLDDKSFEGLGEALAAGDGETAFRMAHTLKGCSQNVGLGDLGRSSSELTELLRSHQITPEASELYQRVTADYHKAVEAITALRDSQ